MLPRAHRDRTLCGAPFCGRTIDSTTSHIAVPPDVIQSRPSDQSHAMHAYSRNVPVWPVRARSKHASRLNNVTPCRLYPDAKRDVSLAAWEWHDANDLSTSPWFGTHGPAVILCYRAFLLLYFVSSMITEAEAGGSMAGWGTYFTNWTFVGLAVHAVIGIAQSARGILRGHKRPEHPEWTRRPYRWHDAVHAAVACTIITMAAHVTIFYWVGLMPDEVRRPHPHPCRGPAASPVSIHAAVTPRMQWWRPSNACWDLRNGNPRQPPCPGTSTRGSRVHSHACISSPCMQLVAARPGKAAFPGGARASAEIALICPHRIEV